MLYTVGVVERDGEEFEVDVEGTFVKGYPGSWEDPPCPDDVEDITATRVDNPKQKVELTEKEEMLFREKLLESYDPSDEPEYEPYDDEPSGDYDD